jgi:hypothetical protein
MDDQRELSLGEFLQDIRGVVVTPRRRFSIIHERGALWGSLLLLVAPAYVSYSFLSGVYFDRDPFPGYAFLIPAIVAALFAGLKAFCLHLVARLLEGKGRYRAATGGFRDLAAALGYTTIPSIIAMLLATTVFLAVPERLGYLFRNFHAATVSVFVAIGSALFVWNIILMVLALRNIYPMRDLKIVAAVVLGHVLFGIPEMGLNLVVGPGGTDAAYMRPVLNERLMRMFVIEPAEEETRRAHVDLHVDRLAYRFRPPKRFDFAIFRPEQALPSPDAPKREQILVGGAGAPLQKDKFKAVGRIVGLPGERVEIAGGRLIINGQPWIEDHLAAEWRGTASLPTRVLGPSEYLILPEDRRLLDSGYSDIVISRARIDGRMGRNKYPLGWWLFRPTVFLGGRPEASSGPR